MVWGKTLDSSVWRRESKETRLVWMTLLMMKDSEGLIHASKVGLADRARVTDSECDEALRVLTSADPNDTSKIDDGRRIREIAGGWQVVNHDLYRFSTEAKREFWRKDKADQRAAASTAGMSGKQKWAYVKGRKAVEKRSKSTLRQAEINGRQDGVADALDGSRE